MDLEEVLEQLHAAANDFSQGDPEPVKKLFSHAEDVTLANPFGPPVRGWRQVAEALDFASSRFRDGSVDDFERIAEYVTADLATLLEMERWRAKVGEREDLTTFELRVTTTLRPEGDDGWKIVHRHADPITTSDASGPLRST